MVASAGSTDAAAAADPEAIWRAAEEAAATGDCATAIPHYKAVLKSSPSPERQIAATHALVLCIASKEDPWAAREMMADLLPVVLQTFGPQSTGLARHHGIWAEAEVRAGALNVAWRRSEAAIMAARAAGTVDPFDHAAELYRLAAIQHARGESDAFLAFLQTERQRLARADWASPGDNELFEEVTEGEPAPGDQAAFADWTRRGLEEFDPRPVYLDLVDTPA
ncbi:MAG: hypothetical protein AAF675_18400 [Pseudomonadota bacterium]